jgi:hypothetical protein
MRILTLFLALFLTFLPEVPFVCTSPTQDICCEEVDDVEEEAVIKTPLLEQSQSDESSTHFVFKESCRIVAGISAFHSIIFRFGRQWLIHCRLRL